MRVEPANLDDKAGGSGFTPGPSTFLTVSAILVAPNVYLRLIITATVIICDYFTFFALANDLMVANSSGW